MKYQAYVDYFKALAERVKAINHDDELRKRFFRFNINEIMGSLRYGIDLHEHILALESYESRVNAEFNDNLRHDRHCAFMVLKHLEQRDDFDAQDAALADTEETMLQVIAAIRKDHRTHGTDIFEKLDYNSIMLQKAGPVFDNCFGWRCTFKFDNHLDLSYKEDNYNDD